ncbi:MAG: aminopeptidase P N-terminal domain-containing protein, partial [Myxococcales bacterium]
MLIALLVAFTHPNPQPPPDLPPSVYRERREKVMKELGGCAAAIAAQGAEPPGPVTEFRQDDDFFWLTGLSEPKAWLLLFPRAKYRRQVLYLKARDPELEQWTGRREPISPALKSQYGVDYIRRGDGGEALLASAPPHECVAIIAPPGDLKDERNDVKAVRQAASALGLKLVYKRDLLVRLREAHGPEEVALMEQAIAATRAGHEAAARSTVAGASERDVQTQMEFGFFGAGATGLSYGPI